MISSPGHGYANGVRTGGRPPRGRVAGLVGDNRRPPAAFPRPRDLIVGCRVIDLVRSCINAPWLGAVAATLGKWWERWAGAERRLSIVPDVYKLSWRTRKERNVSRPYRTRIAGNQSSVYSYLLANESARSNSLCKILVSTLSTYITTAAPRIFCAQIICSVLNN